MSSRKHFRCAGAVLGLACFSHAGAQEPYITDANGCKIYNPSPQSDETISWSGGCQDGYASGSGVLQWLRDGKPGTRLEAPFTHGRPEGTGFLVTASGSRFEGNFVDGEPSGKGVMTWPNGDRYEGDWLRGKRTGTGVLARANGDRYEGDFVDGRWSGKGTFTSTSGGQYTGDWFNNKRQGQGQQVWPDGNRYSGAFVDDKPADPKLIGHQTYSVKADVTGSHIPVAAVTGIDVPPDKSYEQLTPQEKLRVKSQYESMAEGDVPPYPLHGPRRIIEATERLQNEFGVSGGLTLAVTISSKGKPLSVEALRSPDDQFAKAVAEVLMLETYTPALCKGVPCQMQYPFRATFRNH